MIFLLSDMLSRMTTSTFRKITSALLLHSRFCASVLCSMYDYGYVFGYSILDIKHMKVFLKYVSGYKLFRGLYVLSRPGNRIYMGYKKIKSGAVNNYIFKNSFFFFSTSRGILSDVEVVLYKTGGEVSFIIC